MTNAFMTGFADELSKEAGIKDLPVIVGLGLARAKQAVRKGGGKAGEAIKSFRADAKKSGVKNTAKNRWDSLSGDQKASVAGGGAFVGEKGKDIVMAENMGVQWEDLSPEEKDLVAAERVRRKKSKS